MLDGMYSGNVAILQNKEQIARLTHALSELSEIAKRVGNDPVAVDEAVKTRNDADLTRVWQHVCWLLQTITDLSGFKAIQNALKIVGLLTASGALLDGCLPESMNHDAVPKSTIESDSQEPPSPQETQQAPHKT